MTGIFRANNPLNASILFVYGLLLKLGWFLHAPGVIVNEDEGFLYNKLISWLTPLFQAWPSMSSVIAFALLYSQALSLNYYVNSRKLMTHPNYLPAMSYLLVTSFFPEWNMISAPLIISSIAIWIWGRLSNLGNNSGVKSKLFNIGFAIGVSSFLYLPSIAMAVIVILALIITRPPKIAEWIMVLLGIATTWYFLFAGLFLTNELYQFYLHDIIFSKIKISADVTEYVGIILLLMLTVLGGFFVQAETSKQVIQVRKRWSVILVFLIVLSIIPFTATGFHFEYWLLPMVPASILIAASFFYLRSKWINLILHWAMVGFVVYVQFFKH